MDDNIKKQLIEAGVDLQRTMERFLNNEAFYLKFLLRFPKDPNFVELEKAVGEKDMQKMERAAHTLKGVSANLGLDPVAACLGQIVQSIRRGECDDLDAQFAKVKEQYERFDGIIKQISAQ